MKHVLLALVFLGFSALPSQAETPVPHLTVSGQALLEVPADQVRFTLAVVATAPTADEALAANSRRLGEVEKALTAMGLEPGEFRTGRFTIRPEWTPRPRTAERDWRPDIVGYTVSNSLEVTTTKLRQVGEFIETAIDAGADQVDRLDFELSDPNAHRSRAIALATRNARSDAGDLAEAAGVRLGTILSLRLDAADHPPEVRTMRMAAESAAPPLTPGTVTVRAEVSAEYRIEQ